MNVDKVVEKVPERFTINPVIDDKKDIVRVKFTDSPVKEHSPDSSLESTLRKEFALLETNLNFVQILDRDLERRTCRILANTGHSRLQKISSIANQTLWREYSYKVAEKKVGNLIPN